MRHKVFGEKLSRDHDHRQALFKNLARGFFIHNGQVKTTYAKAKAVQSLIERMITRAKKVDLASRRWLFRFFQDQKFVNNIVKIFGTKFTKRNGGYTRIIKLTKRKGDDAIIVRLESVEEIKAPEPEKEKKADKKDKKIKKETKKEVKNKK